MANMNDFYKSLADHHKAQRRMVEQESDTVWKIALDLIETISVQPSANDELRAIAERHARTLRSLVEKA